MMFKHRHNMSYGATMTRAGPGVDNLHVNMHVVVCHVFLLYILSSFIISYSIYPVNYGG